MRIILIPGFGEDVSIFDKIDAYIDGEKLFIDNWKLLNQVDTTDLSAAVYATFLVERFNISSNDVVIGHSMGGWVALQIKQITGCSIVQLASWTNRRKVTRLPVIRPLVYAAFEKRLVLNKFVKKLLINRYYKDAPSEQIFSAVFERLRTGDKGLVVKQLKLVLHPLPWVITTSPDLRIHAKKDHIVLCPDEPFIEVPGDHFSLYTYPEIVGKLLGDFIYSLN